jgi:DNA-binding NtrC family response regulator
VKHSHSKVRLLVVDDDPRALASEQEILEDCGYEVVTASSSEEALSLFNQSLFDLLILDQRLPGMSGTELFARCQERQFSNDFGVIFLTGNYEESSAVEALRLGAVNFLYKPVTRQEFIAVVRCALADCELARDERRLEDDPDKTATLAEIRGQSEALRRTIDLLAQVAPSDTTILLQGETGTGKGLLARAIHNVSHRKSMPFKKLNAGALPADLVESTLFGHKKGAFTGAMYDREGYFHAANGGTLFLDEIGEMPLNLQVKLNHVLEDRRLARLGEETERPVDVRVIAATNCDLRAEVAAKRFRSDLYYRLAQVEATIPPLRDRREDIPSLSIRVLARNRKTAERRITRISPEATAKLKAYSWPGNIRQLASVLKVAMNLAVSDTITPELIRLPDFEMQREPILDNSELPYKDAQRQFEKRYFSDLMARACGNKTKAARMAKIDRTVLYEHLRDCGLLENKNE